MACYRPLNGYRTESGSVRFGVTPPGCEYVRIPCGGCFGCRMQYAENWAIRLEGEAMMHERASFVTLTYSPENVPWYGLDLGDLQRFLKRLRKRSGRLRYFAAGEYGPSTNRPHFHVALFGVDLEERHEHSPVLEEVWSRGFNTCSEFTPGRARYIAGYATKKQQGPRSEDELVCNFETGELVARRREFCVMSRRPGIGRPFFDRYRSDFLRGYVVDRGGVKRALPRYYKTLLRQDPGYVEREEARLAEYVDALPDLSWQESTQRQEAAEANHVGRVGVYGKPRIN